MCGRTKGVCDSKLGLNPSEDLRRKRLPLPTTALIPTERPACTGKCAQTNFSFAILPVFVCDRITGRRIHHPACHWWLATTGTQVDCKINVDCESLPAQ